MYFNVNFNVFFTLIQVHLLVSELYICIRMHGATTKIDEDNLNVTSILGK